MGSFLNVNQLVDSRIASSVKKPLSFTVCAGEMVYICGPNGSGKTTLLRIVSEIENLDKGAITKSASLFFCGHKIGMKGTISVGDNLKFRSALYRNHSEKRIQELLIFFNLEKKQNYPLEALSAGQQRLIAMISAILSPHLLWILDEPFAHLDEQSEKLLKTVLSNHTEKGGAVLLSTHAPIEEKKTIFLS